jgi:hypothetical protein
MSRDIWPFLSVSFAHQTHVIPTAQLVHWEAMTASSRSRMKFYYSPAFTYTAVAWKREKDTTYTVLYGYSAVAKNGPKKEATLGVDRKKLRHTAGIFRPIKQFVYEKCLYSGRFLIRKLSRKHFDVCTSSTRFVPCPRRNFACRESLKA